MNSAIYRRCGIQRSRCKTTFLICVTSCGTIGRLGEAEAALLGSNHAKEYPSLASKYRCNERLRNRDSSHPQPLASFQPSSSPNPSEVLPSEGFSHGSALAVKAQGSPISFDRTPIFPPHNYFPRVANPAPNKPPARKNAAPLGKQPVSGMLVRITASTIAQTAAVSIRTRSNCSRILIPEIPNAAANLRRNSSFPDCTTLLPQPQEAISDESNSPAIRWLRLRQYIRRQFRCEPYLPNPVTHTEFCSKVLLNSLTAQQCLPDW